MKNGTKLMFAAGLLCGTAVPAMAQEADQNAAVQACQRLQLIVNDYEDRFRAEWIDNANDVIDNEGRIECARYVAQAERAIQELDRRDRVAQQSGQQVGQQQAQADADQSRIIVDQPEPRVTVEQNAPRITYTQPRAQVNVDQGTPQVIVRQAQPVVRVEMPRPRITINQPEPEIIVRMPQPDVAVNVPEPQFNVSQAQPDVSVEQGKPQVRVQMDQPEVNVQDQQQAKVQIQRDQPVVTREGAQQQAAVNIDRAQPKVSYEPAKPKVEFEQAGEPQVTFNRTGEPNVRIERMGDNNQTASIEQDQMSPDAVMRLQGNREPQGNAMRVVVADLIDREVVNLRGEDLGEVERVVLQGDRTYIVLSDGGFLGMGDREVALPLDRITGVRGDDELVLQGLSEDDIDAMPRWNGNAGQELGQDDEVEIIIET